MAKGAEAPKNGANPNNRVEYLRFCVVAIYDVSASRLGLKKNAGKKTGFLTGTFMACIAEIATLGFVEFSLQVVEKPKLKNPNIAPMRKTESIDIDKSRRFTTFVRHFRTSVARCQYRRGLHLPLPGKLQLQQVERGLQQGKSGQIAYRNIYAVRTTRGP